jgi:site-specific recombinase XerD
VRVSELLQLTVAGVQASFYDVVGKGGKIRRVLLPTKLASETRRWLYDCRHQEGYVFLNKFGAPITARGLSQRLKDHALACGINPQSVHPHAFRHAFARAFLDAGGDIALLADIMGHSSIETTRIYLRRGAAEQRQLVDQVVTW